MLMKAVVQDVSVFMLFIIFMVFFFPSSSIRVMPLLPESDSENASTKSEDEDEEEPSL